MHKFIITKYALTTGVFVVRGIIEHDNHTMLKVSAEYTYYHHKPDWHATLEEAISRVQVMRAAALKSLRKKVAKLEAMDIEAAVRDAAT